MTHIYAVDCSPLEQADAIAIIRHRLDDSRRQRVDRLQIPEKRAQCAAAGLLLTHLFGCDGKPPALTHGSRGKPYLTGQEDLFFNLSHSGRWVFCAVSDAEVGLDAQVQGPCRETVAARCFTAPELAWMEVQPDERFTRLWTLKEAYVKYTGFGLVLPLSSFTVPLPADGWDEGNHCQWREFSLQDTRIAVCAGSADTILPPVVLSLNTLIV